MRSFAQAWTEQQEEVELEAALKEMGKIFPDFTL
jgi:hypothetical protein